MSQEEYFRKSPLNKEGGALVKLWRDIIIKNKLGSSINVLINRYLNKDAINGTSGSNITKKTKSSITKDISADSMTFSVFLHLLFNLLNVKVVTVSIKIKFANNEESITSVEIPNPNRKELYTNESEPRSNVTGQN